MRNLGDKKNEKLTPNPTVTYILFGLTRGVSVCVKVAFLLF